MSSEEPLPDVRPGDKRASDADRQAVADRLRVAQNEGRLDLSEYDERLQQAYGAKTYAELDALIADIPGVASVSKSQVEPAPPPTPPSEGRGDRWERRRDRRRDRRRTLTGIWSGFGSIFIITNGIWLLQWVTSDHLRPPGYWPIWVWGIIAVLSFAGSWDRHGRR
ncbi:MAG TPA: DUF1707 domain-containing protein [Stackebrandtia sp.]|jgi:hypothetical protein|uniref:DUF1707 SHOCT-like domain-containing protein n=1 Tax=Stackebrandtia sp. TaxID=2023065 RepID=UPI002D51A52C|nr:DUF1707 domain-containing protein [Stackebrandtia sp.]HZE39926.1 DUF1707 domain-containing protein [Stackebrandtia sp.]